MPFDAYFNSLFKMAAKKPISVFKQGVHTGDAPQSVTDPKRRQTWQMPAELHAKVTGGFCLGASLDWLRKVVQREDNKGVDHFKQSRVLRMARSYVKAGAVDVSVQTAPLRSQANALRNQAAQVVTGPEQAKKQLKEDVDAWIRANGGTFNADGTIAMQGSAEVIALFKSKMAELRAVQTTLNDAIDRHNALLEEAKALEKSASNLVDEWNNGSSGSRRAMIWNELAAGLDSDAGKTRRYSGITPVASSARENYATLRDFLVPALSAPAFAPGRGMLVSISLVPPPGHAIALHRDGPDSILLFDPNLGVYKFKELSLLVLGLIVLIDLGYAGKDPDGKVTALGSDHSWQVFAKSDRFLPSAPPHGWASAEDVRRAYDSAMETIEMSAEFAKETLEGSLREAQRLHAEYDKAKTPDAQKAWVDAHNEATLAFNQARGSDIGDAKRVYPRFTGRGITRN